MLLNGCCCPGRLRRGGLLRTSWRRVGRPEHFGKIEGLSLVRLKAFLRNAQFHNSRVNRMVRRVAGALKALVGLTTWQSESLPP